MQCVVPNSSLAAAHIDTTTKPAIIFRYYWELLIKFEISLWAATQKSSLQDCCTQWQRLWPRNPSQVKFNPGSSLILHIVSILMNKTTVLSFHPGGFKTPTAPPSPARWGSKEPAVWEASSLPRSVILSVNWVDQLISFNNQLAQMMTDGKKSNIRIDHICLCRWLKLVSEASIFDPEKLLTCFKNLARENYYLGSRILREKIIILFQESCERKLLSWLIQQSCKRNITALENWSLVFNCTRHPAHPNEIF